MGSSEELADRVREVLGARPGVTERKMFGGLGWMIGGNMAVGAMSDGGLLVRLEPEEAERAWREPEAGPFGREGAKPMTGFVRVDAADLSDEALARWVDAGADFAQGLPPK